MQLVEALKEGFVEDIPKPERHIETWLSDIFLYETDARKVAKYIIDADIGDLTNQQERKEFYTSDFTWNHLFAPEIYTALQGMCEVEHVWKPCENTHATEYCILMNKINADDTLINRLSERRLTKRNVERITEKLLTALDTANERFFEEQTHKLGKGVYELMDVRLANYRHFSLSAKGIPTDITQKRADALSSFHSSHHYFKDIGDTFASVTIDGHSANIIFIENEPTFMDVYWPMPAFRIVDHVLAFARIAACIRVFMGDELAGGVYTLYAKSRALPPKEILDFYEAYNAFVMGYYFVHIKRLELVRPYFNFADKTLARLEALV